MGTCTWEIKLSQCRFYFYLKKNLGLWKAALLATYGSGELDVLRANLDLITIHSHRPESICKSVSIFGLSVSKNVWAYLQPENFFCKIGHIIDDTICERDTSSLSSSLCLELMYFTMSLDVKHSVVCIVICNSSFYFLLKKNVYGQLVVILS